MGSHQDQGPASQAISYYILLVTITLLRQVVKGLRDFQKAQNNTEA
jgi:hypothetical protein